MPSTLYRVTFARIGHNHHVAPQLTTAAGPAELTQAIVAFAGRYRPGPIWADLAEDLSAGHLHQLIGDNLGEFTIAVEPSTSLSAPSVDSLLVAAHRAAATHDGAPADVVIAATVGAVLSELARIGRDEGSRAISEWQLGDLAAPARRVLTEYHTDWDELIPLDDDGEPLAFAQP